MGGVGVGSCWTGGTEAGAVGVVADETGAAVLAVVNVVLSGGGELSERTRLASIVGLVEVFASGALFTGGGAGRGMPTVEAGSTVVACSNGESVLGAKLGGGVVGGGFVSSGSSGANAGEICIRVLPVIIAWLAFSHAPSH